MSKPLVYVASPYTKGDPAINTYFQCKVFDLILTDQKVTPIVPLWSHLQAVVLPRPYDDWLNYDFELIARCDALLRLNAQVERPGIIEYEQTESKGADAECTLAAKLGLPVFNALTDLYEWTENIYAAK